MSHRLSRFCVRLPRVFALAAILMLTVFVMLAAVPLMEWRLHHFRHELTPLPMNQKNQGILLQREAFSRSNVIPLYGSSELTRESKNRAGEFFADAPTGFQVCPIGGAGNTSLVTLEKVASLGGVVRGHKMAFILSPSWFQRPNAPADHYAGNFSALQAMRALENPLLRDDVKRRLAVRMLDYSDTLESHPMLMMQARLWRGDVPFASLVRAALSVALVPDVVSLEYEDVIQSAVSTPRLKTARHWEAVPRTIDWKTLVEADHALVPPPKLTSRWHGELPSPLDTALRRAFATAEHGEWADFELLLDAIQDLGTDALIISVPMAGKHRDLEGVSSQTRSEFYYTRIESMCRRHHVAVKSFADHDLDEDFLVDFTSHPTPVGWLHINRVLDDFFHNRLSSRS